MASSGLCPPAFLPRDALAKQAQAEKDAIEAKKRAAEALAGRADAQRALDNVAKCVLVRRPSTSLDLWFPLAAQASVGSTELWPKSVPSKCLGFVLCMWQAWSLTK
jgi:hypothetical protein